MHLLYDYHWVLSLLYLKYLNYKMIQSLMCVLIVKSVFLDLSRFLWNHYVICDWEEWVSITFYLHQLWKYTSSPSSLIKGLSEFLFGCLSTVCNSPFDTFQKKSKVILLLFYWFSWGSWVVTAKFGKLFQI